MTLLLMVQTLSAGSIGSALRRITRDNAPEHPVEDRPVSGPDGGEAVVASRAMATLFTISAPRGDDDQSPEAQGGVGSV